MYSLRDYIDPHIDSMDPLIDPRCRFHGIPYRWHGFLIDLMDPHHRLPLQISQIPPPYRL